MAHLTVASKANQATTLPALLVASYANQTDPNVSINIKIEDLDKLDSGDGASVELVLKNESPKHGSEQVVGELIGTYRFLQGKHEDSVGTQLHISIVS